MRQGEMIDGGGSFRLSRAEIVYEGLDLIAKGGESKQKIWLESYQVNKFLDKRAATSMINNSEKIFLISHT